MAATKSSPNSPTLRVEWVDYAKGIGIFLVVLVHITNGIVSAGLSLGDIGRQLGKLLSYDSIDMPLFFFLAGLFIIRSAQKPLSAFFADRLRTMAYPYFVWSLISLIVATVMAGRTNTEMEPLSVKSALALFYAPILQYWYLYAIFFVVMMVAMMVKFKIDLRWFLAFSFGLLLFQQITDQQLRSTVYWVWRSGGYVIFFALAMIFSDRILQFFSNASTRTLTLAAAGGLGIWIVYLLFGAPNLLLFSTLILGCGVCGASALSAVLARYNWLAEIKRWGNYSLEIYLAHVIVGAGVRVVLQRVFNVEIGLIVWVAAMIAGLYVPILMQWFFQKIGFRYAFTFPKPETQPAPQPATASGD